LLYNVPSMVDGGSSVDVTGGSIANVGAVLSFRLWGATKRGAGEVQMSSTSSPYASSVESFNTTSRRAVPSRSRGADLQECRRWDLNPHAIAGNGF
jgi:hypothetical protein